MGMPHEAVSQLGFRPYVATWLPEEVTWYTAGAFSSDPSPVHPLPWASIGYGYWFPRPYNAYALHRVIAFDETTQTVDLTTNIYIPGQKQTPTTASKKTVDINGHTATLFELQGAIGTPSETHVIGVEWREGTLWLRVTAVTTGQYFPDKLEHDNDVLAWDVTNTDVLLRVARSAQVYTGCDKKATGDPTSN
jgi:hypothetical protein